MLVALVLLGILTAHSFLDLSAPGRSKRDLLGHEIAALLTVLRVHAGRRKESHRIARFYVDAAHCQALLLPFEVAVRDSFFQRVAREIVPWLYNDLHCTLLIHLHVFEVTAVRRHTLHRLIIVVLYCA